MTTRDGNDYIDAGAHNDRIIGGTGKDTILGNKGNDFFDCKDGEVDSLNGGDGTDVASADTNDIVKLVETRS